ncbi:MAG TPA: DGQHR domain-containing protein DpdB [Solirubrobacterales bacterium]|nr:DGQHR domain-containing protein DpdB [Solirubrobacterales bacterium]
MAKEQIRLPALVVEQGNKRLYSFAVDGKKLPSFTTVSRIHRKDDKGLGGYQRPESLAHVASIKRYLESANAVLPNALVVAFDERVDFVPSDDGAGTGEIVIPIDDKWPDEDKPGWIVDGQQRSAAIREANVEEFPVFVTAFITNSVAEQRSQFILVNSTKPLPKGLIYELLPSTPAADLPVALLKKRYPSLLLERLNFDEDSPLHMRIRTTTAVGGSIKDNSILKTLSASLEDGALYRYFDSESGEGDADSMLELLRNFWGAVASTFAKIWDLPPRRSRLVHGAGIAALGCLMDEIAYVLGEDSIPTQEEFALELGRIADKCAWTEGSWEFRPGEICAWNELQNTPGDILRLSDHLLNLYRAERALDDLAERRAA